MKESFHASNQIRGWSLNVWREMIGEMINSHELIWRLFIRDFTARFRQSIFGILWAVILPLVTVATFVLLNRSGVLNVGDTDVPYPVYVLLGLTIWQVFAGGLTACSNALVSGGGMVAKINFPKETLVFAAMGQVLFELLVRMILLAVVMIIFQTAPAWTAIFFPLTLMPLVMLTLGLGFFLSLINVVFRDIANVVTLVMTFLMFLTPVLYPAPKTGLFAKLMTLNPLSNLITGSRDIIFTGYLTDPIRFAWLSTLVVMFFFFAWRVFHLVEFKMAEAI